MKKLNVKLLIGLAGLGILLGGSAFFAHRYQVRRTARALFREAGAEQRRGRLDRADEALGRYLGLRPDDTDALAWHATLLDRLATTPRAKLGAAMAYEELLRREPSRRAYRLRLAGLSMELGRFADARHDLEFLLQSRPGDAEIEMLLGENLEASGDARAAASWYRNATVHDRHMLRAFERLAALLRTRLNESNHADDVMNEMVVANFRSFRAYLDRALYRQKFPIDIDGPAEDIEKAHSLAPEEPDVILEVAAAAVRKPDFDDARRGLVRGVERYPDDPRMYHSLAYLELRDDHDDAADDWLRKGIARMPGQVSLRWMLADHLAGRGATSALAEQSARLRKDGFPEGPTDFLDACVHFNQGEWREARHGFESALPKLSDRPDLKARAYDLLARCFGRLGDADQQIGAFRKAVAIDPLGVASRLGLASSLAAIGKIDEAVSEYRALLPGVPEVRLALARLLLAHNRSEPALVRRWDEVAELLKDLPADRDEVTILRSEALDAQGRHDEARTLLEQAAARHADRPEIRLALADLVGRLGKADAALAILDDASQPLNDCVGLRLGRARLLALRGGPGVVEAIERLGQDLDSFSTDDRRALLRGIAVEFTRLGDDDRAAQFWARVADGEPDDLESRLALFDHAIRGGDEAAMTRLQAEIRSIEGEPGSLAVMAEARRLMWRAGRGDPTALGAARTIVADLAARRPDWALATLTLAEIDDRAGRSKEATKGYIRTIELGPHDPAILRKATQLLAEDGRYAEADRVLRRLPDSSLATADLLRTASEIAIRASEPARALDLARQAAAVDPDGSGEQVWLGQVLWSAGRPAEAESALRRATKLAGDDPEPWVALVRFLAETGRGDEAEATLKALDSAPLLVNLATVREREGRYQDAEALYRLAIERNARDGVPLNNLAWLTVLKEGDAPKALDLINRAIDLEGPEPELLDTRGVIYLAMGRGDDALEDINGAVSASPSAARFFHLAQVHLQTNDRKAAVEAMGRAKALGLVAGSLHPLERPTFDRMVGALVSK